MVEQVANAQNRYKDKVCFLTGGTTGIGLAIAQLMALEGGSVIISSSQEKNVEEALQKMKGLKVEGLVCDVSKSEDRKKAVAFVAEKHGRVDVVVLNAGINGSLVTPNVLVPEDKLDRLYQVNLKGVFMLIQGFYPLLKNSPKDPNILVTSSITAKTGPALAGPYAFFKAALDNMVLSMQREFLRDKIRINAINPGLIETELAGPILKHRDKLKPEQIGQPHHIACFVGVICSEAGQFMRGSTVVIDGMYGRL